MSDLIDVAKGELGYKASESNTKYGKIPKENIN